MKSAMDLKSLPFVVSACLNRSTSDSVQQDGISVKKADLACRSIVDSCFLVDGVWLTNLSLLALVFVILFGLVIAAVGGAACVGNFGLVFDLTLLTLAAMTVLSNFFSSVGFSVSLASLD